MWVINTFKKIVVFIALWIVSFFVVKNVIHYKAGDSEISLYSLAIAILVVFLWNWLNKKNR